MEPQNNLQFIAPDRLIEGLNISRTFLWRLEKAGLIQPYYLLSRKLYKIEDVRRLEGMISRGELRVELRGAARTGGTKN